MLSVDEALAAICGAIQVSGREEVGVEAAIGRVLSDDVFAAIDQPPHDGSAMDGYAVRFADARKGARLRVKGEAAAGAPFNGSVGAGEAVRIFTGGVIPEGADHIVIQENTIREGASISVCETSPKPSHIRRRGVDFECGARIGKAGAEISPVSCALFAAANVSSVSVRRKPVIAFFDNGDELAEPGAALGPGEVVASNRFAIAGLIDAWGGVAHYLGRAVDDEAAVAEKFDQAGAADAVLAIGGASVGDRDCVRGAFAAMGGQSVFSKVAVKPGKPTWFGQLGGRPVLGLPGNPASAIVCAILFLRPMVAAALGAAPAPNVRARLGEPLAAGGGREEYIRAELAAGEGALVATPFPKQDSSLLTPLASAGCLIRRMQGAPPAAAGDLVECAPIRDILSGYGR